jgi:hypothetical protein
VLIDIRKPGMASDFPVVLSVVSARDIVEARLEVDTTVEATILGVVSALFSTSARLWFLRTYEKKKTAAARKRTPNTTSTAMATGEDLCDSPARIKLLVEVKEAGNRVVVSSAGKMALKSVAIFVFRSEEVLELEGRDGNLAMKCIVVDSFDHMT